MKNLSEYLNIIQQVLEPEGNVIAAFVFGSMVTDKYRNNSDLDIAILPKSEISAAEFIELKYKLDSKIDRDVDLVIISSNTSMFLKYEIAKKGKLVFTKDPQASTKFIVYTPLMYFDFMQTRKIIDQAFIKRVTSESHN